MIYSPKQLLLITTLLSSVWSELFSKEAQFLDKQSLVLHENFERDVIGNTRWVSTKTNTGFKCENGFYHWDCQQSRDSKKRVSLKHPFNPALKNMVLEIDFTPDENFFSFSATFNDEQGHCMVNVFEVDKLYTYKYPEKDKIRAFPEYVDCTGANIKAGQTYRVVIELWDEQFFIHLDDQHYLIGQHPRFKNLKHSFQFSIQGGTGKIDDIKVWEGTLKNKRSDKNWISLKTHREKHQQQLDSNFYKKKNLADARVQYNTDPQYSALLKATSDLILDLKSKYPFYGGVKKNELAQHKKHLQQDNFYKSMVKNIQMAIKSEETYVMEKYHAEK